MKIQKVHFNTPEKIKTTVKLENGSFECEIIGVNSYKNEHPTLTILLDDGAVFDYIHPSQLGKSRNVVDSFLCPDVDVAVYKHEHIKKLLTIMVNGNVLYNCKYHFSVDFYKDNASINFVETDDGEFYFVPNYKMIVGNKLSTRDYVKIRDTFELPSWANYAFRCNLGGLYMSEHKPKMDYTGWILDDGMVECIIDPVVDWHETLIKIK